MQEWIWYGYMTRSGVKCVNNTTCSSIDDRMIKPGDGRESDELSIHIEQPKAYGEHCHAHYNAFCENYRVQRIIVCVSIHACMRPGKD
jgi:hypothetical protein